MSLEDWLNDRWLHRHETIAEEMQALLHFAEEDIRSAEIEGIASGWKFNMANTAALLDAVSHCIPVDTDPDRSANTRGISILFATP